MKVDGRNIMNHEYYPLSLSQWNILNQELKFDNTPINNICTTLNIYGRVDFIVLQETINYIIEKDASLRLRFANNESTRQYINPYTPLVLPIFDFTLTNKEGIDKWIEAISKELMPLYDHDMFQFYLYKTEECQGGVLIKTHHLISDGYSQVLLCNRIAEIYLKKIFDQQIPLFETFCYLDHIDKQQAYINSGHYQKDQRYWQDITSKIPKAVSIKEHKSAALTYTGNRLTFELDERSNHLIFQYCNENRISPFSLFYMALAIWLKRAFNINESTIGVPILNRNDHQEKNTSGMFVSTLPFYSKIDENWNINEFNQHLMMDWLELLKHQKFPFNDIYQLAKRNNPQINELFHIVLSYQNSLAYQIDSTQVYFDGRWNYSGYQGQDLCIHVSHRQDQQRYTIDYDYLVQLFSKDEIKKLHEMLMIIIQDALTYQQKPLYSLNYLSDDMINKVLYRFSSPYQNYLRLDSLKSTFVELAQKIPNKVALIADGERMTYRRLLDEAMQFSHHLTDIKGPIVLILPRSFDLLIMMITCIISNKTFIIIDPNTPIERINEIIDNANANLAIVNEPTPLMINVLKYSELDKRPNQLNSDLDHDNIVYIVYTSGTTGKPKGVRIKEKSLMNFARFSARFYGHQAVLSICNVSFDAFILETLVSIINYQTVVLANDQKLNNANYLANLINDHAVGIMAMTPSRLLAYMQNQQFIKVLTRMETIICGGELFPSQLLQKLKQYTNAKIINQYGPSEATIGVSYQVLNNAKMISVGKPMVGCKVYVLDDHLLPLPINAIGEIYITGICLADGYENDDKQTAISFIINPFVKNELMYRTKDNGYWNEDGELVITGRSDLQIKYHGYRIELQEISSRLNQHPLIEDSTVILDTINEKELLIAYYVSNKIITNSELRTFLAPFLPYYMLPQYFVRLDNIPLNSNDKIDKSLLPKLDISNNESLPTTKFESTLLEIFKNNLKCEKLFTDSDYFLNGGDSLSALELLTIIETDLGYKLSIIDLYTLRNVKDIASHLLKTPPSLNVDHVIKNNDDHYLMTPIQCNIYFLQMLNQDCAYNMPGYIELKEDINLEKLEKSLNQIIANEPVLRSSFMIKDNQMVAKINDCRVNIDRMIDDDLDTAIACFVKPFDLAQAPLIRVTYLQIKDDNYLMLDLHHIIMDGISTSLFIDRLVRAYHDQPIDHGQFDYRDHAAWLLNNNIEEQKQRWLRRLDKLPLPFKPTHNPYALPLSSYAKRVSLAIDERIIKAIESTSKQLKITNFDILISAFSYLLHVFSKQDLISVGTVTSGRNKPHLNTMLGVFINTLPLLTDFSKIKNINDLLTSTSTNMMELLNDQDVSVNSLLESLRAQNKTEIKSLFNVIFSYRPFKSTEFILDDQVLNLVSIANKDLKMDLSIDIYQDHDHHFIQYDYDQAIFSDKLIHYYHQVYLNILQAFTNDQDTNLTNIELLSYKQRFDLESDLKQITPYPYLPIDDLIDNQAHLSPDKTAIIFHDEKMDYQTFRSKSDTIAANLIANGLKKNETVAIALRRGFELLIAMVAVNKAGGCYVPLDLDFPDQRLAYMIKTSECKFIIKNSINDRIFINDLIVIALDDLKELKFKPVKKNMNDNMYILFTSGSTGEPKGVVLSFKALSNLNQAMNFIFNDIETVLCSTNPVFDVFITESLLALAHGKTIIMCDDDQMLYPWHMASLISDHHVDLVQFTPTRCSFNIDNQAFNTALKTLRSIILVGEPLTSTLLQKLQLNKDLNIYNFYGPTEAAVYVSYKNLRNANEVTIGKPLANCRLYVLDEARKLTMPTISGELYLAGECLAKGYINNPDITQAVFVDDIFFNNEKMYKTGDIVYQDLNGDLVYLRRKDQQIKLDGHRIELDEINAVLSSHQKVKQAHTIVIKNGDDVSHIETYVVADCDVEQLKTYLKEILPNYMIPAKINIVDNIPLTASGKADLNNLKRLPISSNINDRPFQLKDQIISAWKKVLNNENIDDDLSFFDQGGTSLKALMLINAYYEMDKTMTMKEFYQHPYLSQQLKLLDQTTSIISSIDKITYRDKTPESLALHYCANILLTGASGFLGSHILFELCKQTRKIYCIVRDKQRFINAIDHYFTHDWYLLNIDKIIIIKGDITSNNLGLSSSMYQYLCDNTKEIIHCAANVNHYGDDDAIIDVNVNGTENIVNLATLANASLHHISTTAIFGDKLDQHDILDHFDEDMFDVNQNWQDNAYTKSKFLAENIIFKAIDNKLKAHVYRIDHLIDRQIDNVFQINPETNELYRIFKGLNMLNAVPDILADHQFYLTPVDDCAKAFIHLMYTDQTVYHVFNPKALTIRECLPQLKIITIEQYQELIKTIDINLNPYIPDITAALIRRSKVNVNLQITCDKTTKTLSKQGFDWPILKIDRILK
ncbi:MAG: amino acid adenylation domain-containing protein [Erysipelotrichaceae bacterium]|nr:amino acid adenylation domain-containing protein [Erysipelotrichaceae bacterium]